MNQKILAQLYDTYEDDFQDIYQKALEAMADGLDWKDIITFSELIKEIIDIVNSFQDKLSLEAKKAFIVFIIFKFYNEQEKLPWFMKISIVQFFIRKKVIKLVDKAIDYLHEKGVVHKAEL